jgi:hypothetical protein
MNKKLALAIALAGGWAGSAWARQGEPAFTGAYAGAGAGVIEHHYFLEVTQDGQTTGSYYRATGIGASIFAGYDLAVSSRLRLGAEIEGTVGGATPRGARPRGGPTQPPCPAAPLTSSSRATAIASPAAPASSSRHG